MCIETHFEDVFEKCKKKRILPTKCRKITHFFVYIKGFSDSFTAYKIRFQNEFSMSKTFKLENNRNKQ